MISEIVPNTSNTDRRRPGPRVLIATCAAVLATAGLTPASEPIRTKPVPTVYVRFQLEPRTEDAKNLFDRGNVEWRGAAVATMIEMIKASRSLEEGRLPWDYRPGDPQPAEPQRGSIWLDITATEQAPDPSDPNKNLAWNLRLTCQSPSLYTKEYKTSPPFLLRRDSCPEPNPNLVRNPDNVDLTPAFKCVVSMFQSFALDSNNPVLHELLLEVAPIGQGALLIDPKNPRARDPNVPIVKEFARGLLHLSWRDYNAFSSSKFEIFCVKKGIPQAEMPKSEADDKDRIRKELAQRGLSTSFFSSGADRPFPDGGPEQALLVIDNRLVAEDLSEVEIDLKNPDHQKWLAYYAGPQFESWFFLTEFVKPGRKHKKPASRPGPGTYTP